MDPTWAENLLRIVANDRKQERQRTYNRLHTQAFQSSFLQLEALENKAFATLKDLRSGGTCTTLESYYL